MMSEREKRDDAPHRYCRLLWIGACAGRASAIKLTSTTPDNEQFMLGWKAAQDVIVGALLAMAHEEG